LIAKIPVGLDTSAPHRHWQSLCSCTCGSCNSGSSRGDVQMLTFGGS
jgi:hypothetical protein